MATQASPDYTLWSSTVSDLGNRGCREVGDRLLCSDWSPLMNTTFIWFGATLAIGAVLVGRHLLRGRAGRIAVGLWVIAGVSTIAVGLVPADVNPDLHGRVATPVFLAQPLALALTAVALRPTRRRLAAWCAVVATLSLIGAVIFISLGPNADGTGAAERLALWLVYPTIGAMAWTSRSEHPSSPRESSPAPS